MVWHRRKLESPFPYDRFYADSQAIVDLVLRKACTPYLDASHRERIATNWRAVSFILWYEMFFNGNAALLEEITELAQGNGGYADYGIAA